MGQDLAGPDFTGEIAAAQAAAERVTDTPASIHSPDPAAEDHTDQPRQGGTPA